MDEREGDVMVTVTGKGGNLNENGMYLERRRGIVLKINCPGSEHELSAFSAR